MLKGRVESISFVCRIRNLLGEIMKLKNIVVLLILSCACFAQAPQSDLKQFIRVDSNVVALTHVRIVDGTGAAPMEDQTILIVDGKITEIHPSAAVFAKEGIKALDLNGYTILPG